MIAQALVGPLKDRGGSNKWLNHVMEIFALFMICGLGTTLLIPETKRQSLEYLAWKYHDDPAVDDESTSAEVVGSEGFAMHKK